MDILITKNIKISVQPHYMDKHSSPEERKFLFTYDICIENLGSEKVQLLKRFWRIVDGTFQVKQVFGDGVIGKQPILDSGESHCYSSWSPIQSPIGKMSGYYLMKRLSDDTVFRVKIPDFTLAANYIFN